MAEDDDQRVIHLAFDNPHVPSTPDRLMYRCKPCGNKVFTISKPVDKPQTFGEVRCAACLSHIGYVGWTDTAEG